MASSSSVYEFNQEHYEKWKKETGLILVPAQDEQVKITVLFFKHAFHKYALTAMVALCSCCALIWFDKTDFESNKSPKKPENWKLWN